MAKRGPKRKAKIISIYSQSPSAEALPLTVESLRNYKGCAHYSDEECAQIIKSLRTLASVLLKRIMKQNKGAENHVIPTLNQQAKAA